MTWPVELHATLSGRATCEHVAALLREVPLTPAARLEARRVASARPAWWVTSMPEQFDVAEADARPQLAAAHAITGEDASRVNPADPGAIRFYINDAGIRAGGWQAGHDWKTGRRDRADLRHLAALNLSAGLDPGPVASRRQYNRACRVLRRLAEKADAIDNARAIRRATLVGRSGFAADIPLERFAADPRAAAFIAYWVARKNRRREFTLDGRENPMDRLAELLLAACFRRPKSTDWEMIAWACPIRRVLARLDDRQLGELLGRWWAVMSATAERLAAVYPEQVDRRTMIVRRGMDSSTWNLLAGAYNAARAGWVNCLAASGTLHLLEPFCPGKVMRLMAADLVYWHTWAGDTDREGAVDPNTAVWAQLPFPWDVVHGVGRCPASLVRLACEAVGLDPVKSGWLGPRATGKLAEFRPTPELVHGVTVASPEWAALLRSAGVFSGKAGAADAGELRAAAQEAGLIHGPLPVYGPDGAYMGATGSDN